MTDNNEEILNPNQMIRPEQIEEMAREYFERGEDCERNGKKKEAIENFNMVYALSCVEGIENYRDIAKEKLEKFYNKKEEALNYSIEGAIVAVFPFTIAAGIAFAPACMPAFVGCFITGIILQKEASKYENKIEELNKSPVENIKNIYNFLYDNDGNFKETECDHMKGKNMTNIRKHAAKYMFSALTLGEFEGKELAFYQYEFAQMIIETSKKYLRGFGINVGWQYMKASANKGYSKAIEKWEEHLGEKRGKGELYSNLIEGSEALGSEQKIVLE